MFGVVFGGFVLFFFGGGEINIYIKKNSNLIPLELLLFVFSFALFITIYSQNTLLSCSLDFITSEIHT